jgi:hypothetical protein
MALHRHFHLRRVLLPGQAAPSAREGVVRRISAAIERWRQSRAEQEAGRFIADHGARLTDDVERQLTAHFSGRGFPSHTPPRSFRPFTLRS